VVAALYSSSSTKTMVQPLLAFPAWLSTSHSSCTARSIHPFSRSSRLVCSAFELLFAGSRSPRLLVVRRGHGRPTRAHPQQPLVSHAGRVRACSVLALGALLVRLCSGVAVGLEARTRLASMRVGSPSLHFCWSFHPCLRSGRRTAGGALAKGDIGSLASSHLRAICGSVRSDLQLPEWLQNLSPFKLFGQPSPRGSTAPGSRSCWRYWSSGCPRPRSRFSAATWGLGRALRKVASAWAFYLKLSTMPRSMWKGVVSFGWSRYDSPLTTRRNLAPRFVPPALP